MDRETTGHSERHLSLCENLIFNKHGISNHWGKDGPFIQKLGSYLEKDKTEPAPPPSYQTQL